MIFTPYDDKIVIKPDPKNPYITDEYKESGTVIRVGADVTFVKEGDTVYFDSWGCSKIDVDGETFFVISDLPEVIQGKIAKDAA